MGRRLEDWIDSYMDATDNTEPPESFRRWVAISAIAAALQRKCWLQWDKKLYPNLYVILVAPPGKARKGTSISPIASMVKRLGVPLSAEAITREALIQAMAASETETEMDAETTLKHSSLTVISPELTVFLGYQNSSLISNITDWYDCSDTWQYVTKTSGADHISGVFLNLLGATTPDLLRTALPLDAIGGGLTSRMLFIYEENKGKKVALPFQSDEDKRKMEDLYRDLEEIHKMKGQFTVTPGFLSDYEYWYMNEAEKIGTPLPKLAGYVERRPTHLLKLCQIMAASRGTMVIDKIDMLRARANLMSIEPGMASVFGGIGASPVAPYIQKIISEVALSGPQPMRLMYKMFASDISYTNFEDMFKMIRGMGYLLINRNGQTWIASAKEKLLPTDVVIPGGNRGYKKRN